MLLRPDETFIDKATKRAERVFPRGIDWQTFSSQLPGKEVFANSVLDPAIGIGGDLAMKTFAAADWQNWVSTTQISLFELGTRVGMPQLEGTGLAEGMSHVYTTLGSTINTIKNFEDPAEMLPELLKNTAIQILQMVCQSNIVTQTVAQVLAVAVWAVDVGRAQVEANLGKNISFPPLQTEDPATDTWQVNRVFEVFRSKGTGGVVYPDGGIEPASNADYTSFYLPAYKHHQPWQFQHRAQGLAAQQGHPKESRGPKGDAQYQFDPGDASTFGFMPGTTTSLRVLQASYRFYQAVRATVGVDRYSLICRGEDKPCYKTTKTFDGKRDCRQCVRAESVWPVEGLGWAYGGAPLNATTPGENVGSFYPSTNKLLSNLLDMVARPGPLLYTIDVELIHSAWKKSFEQFWEFAASEWRRHNGAGWRGLISRLATFMTAFEVDDELRLGGREPAMPVSLISSPREADFKVAFSNSIFSQIIAPFCRDLAAMQLHYLDAVEVAYIPPGAGALYYAGSIRKNKLGDHFTTARRELLGSTKRMLIDLRQVSDPDYRAELERVGVKASPVKQSLHGSPGVGGQQLLAPDIKPRRAPGRPKVSRASPFEGAVELVQRAAAAQLKVSRAKPKVARATPPSKKTNTGLALGVAAGSVLLTAAGIMHLRRMTDD
ncbi:hypothetical protein [Enhygromyxa salina]|uniref:Uncharacterized protein n=1 Tax=Enhygromyxa salina TaxID=215803 RepID=A0A2S9Y0B3_9BACT|nr:hypothetical protein [Enhygromyxa salina]PRP98529.1 hypothetical protein ENSA7_64720 [Enhygromyxa salina]